MEYMQSYPCHGAMKSGRERETDREAEQRERDEAGKKTGVDNERHLGTCGVRSGG